MGIWSTWKRLGSSVIPSTLRCEKLDETSYRICCCHDFAKKKIFLHLLVARLLYQRMAETPTDKD